MAYLIGPLSIIFLARMDLEEKPPISQDQIALLKKVYQAKLNEYL